MNIRHLNCGILHAPPSPEASCHCLLLEHGGQLALVDTGIGLKDIAHPQERIGQSALDAAGFQFHESLTAVRQIERLGFQIADVTDIILTHGDQDHAGGLADFPNARVHVSKEEYSQLESDHNRYSLAQFTHQPHWVTHATSPEQWFGLEARRLNLFHGVNSYLIPLFGHTLGHCGVAIQDEDTWLLHVGDAYYLRAELSSDEHPVSILAAQRADDDALRCASLSKLRSLARKHGSEIKMCGYHDFSEFPSKLT
jgi:glyoxylase-like metal-dependent hydrolase (beta-lactamase superfamily II)